jgi:hypothetical protein
MMYQPRRGQQPSACGAVGILLNAPANDPESLANIGAFLQALAPLGWAIGRNVRIDVRWAEGNTAEVRRHAAEFAALAPDVILAEGGSTVAHRHCGPDHVDSDHCARDPAPAAGDLPPTHLRRRRRSDLLWG